MPPSESRSFPLWLRLLAFPIVLLVGLAAVGAAIGAFVLLLLYPNLPSIDVLTDYQPKIPLRIYTSDGVLIGEFGEERRAVVKIAEVPAIMKQAILAAEDERFYQHAGVDTLGVVRAAYSNLMGGGKRQGASTITMQVARNFFLSSEKTITRKAYEAMLAFKIEASLSKDQILEIYINQIYLGQRAYGFASAAQIYYGKNLKDILPGEAAMLAGLPKAPSSFNPVVNPKRAKLRQLYVLRRMHELGHLNDAQFAEAQKAPINVKRDANEFAIHAEYAAEMVRQMLFERYPDEVYSKGFRVYTTLTKADQDAAYKAVRRGVLDYDKRHGYRGAEGYAELTGTTEEDYEDALSDVNDSDDLLAALVLEASPKQVKVFLRGGDTHLISGEGLKFAARMLEDKAAPNKRIQRGAIVRVQKDEKGAWAIVQLPEVEAAFLSVNPQDGAVRSLVGGFDFNRSKFNHVTQAWRQPGSSFKPFIYSASLEKGFTPATVINDAPVVVDPFLTGGQTWEPKNYDGKYEGPMRMRTALAKSKNMVSIRILQAISPQYAQDYVTRFGFDAERHPPYLTMALGAGSVTLWQMARGYSTFANTGYRIEPYIVSRIVDDRGNVLAQAQPQKAGDETLRVIDARNAFVMDSMLRDVTRYGTGTTNDFVDAWFNGYHPTLVGVAWIGFDQPKKLGNNETGGSAALPMWINYMSKVLNGVPELPVVPPEGVVSARVNEAGMQSPDGKISEFFYKEGLPPAEGSAAPAGAKPSDEVKNQLF
jgi:penicillin-binding protein 1A